MKVFVAAALMLASSVALAQGVGNAGAVFVSAPDGPTADTRDAFQRIRQEGFSSIVVMIENVDQVRDEELLALIEAEIEGLAAPHGFDAGSVEFRRCAKACDR